MSMSKGDVSFWTKCPNVPVPIGHFVQLEPILSYKKERKW